MRKLKAPSLLVLCAALIAPCAALAQNDYEYLAGFHNKGKLGKDAPVKVEVHYIHEPGAASQPEHPLEEMSFRLPRRTGFNAKDFARDSMVGSAEVGVYTPGQGAAIRDAEIVKTGRDRFSVVSRNALEGPSDDDTGVAYVELLLDRERYELNARVAGDVILRDLDLDFGRISLERQRQTLFRLPPNCPRRKEWTFGVTFDTFTGNLEDRDPCPGKAGPRPDCSTNATAVSAPTDNQGRRFGRPSFSVSAACDTAIDQVRVTVEDVVDGCSNNCRVTKTVSLDDTAVFDVDAPPGSGISVSGTTSQDVKEGDKVTFELVGEDGRPLKVDDVM